MLISFKWLYFKPQFWSCCAIFGFKAQLLSTERLAVFMVKRSARLSVTATNPSSPLTYYEDIYLVSDTSREVLLDHSSPVVLHNGAIHEPETLGEFPASVEESHHPRVHSESSPSVARPSPAPARPSSKSECSTPSSRQSRRLSLQVSNDLHRQLKIIALEDEETMNSLIVGVLRSYLSDRDEALKRLQRASRR